VNRYGYRYYKLLNEGLCIIFQYAEHFAGCLVDARLLDHLSKKDLEKYLGVTRKFHLASIAHGVHLLRMVAYDRQVKRVKNYSTPSH